MEKWKKNKGFIILTSLITLLPVMAGIFLWQKLPDQMATHFDFQNVPNGWSSKTFAVFGLPLFILAGHLFCTFYTSADPKRQHINDKLYRLVLLLCPAISVICGIAIYGYALNFKFDMGLFSKLFMGLLFLVIGNYLPKCKQNYTVGIKLPWTLDNEDNWNYTHRFAGWLWVFTGLFFILASLINLTYTWILPAVTIAAAFVPCIVSFLYYQKQKKL